MRVVSAYLLAQLGGNASPSASDIESICKAGGVEVDSNNVSKFLKEVEGKSVDELIAAGREKLASMPAGGGGGGGGGGVPAGGGGGDAAPAAEEKKVEEESEDEDMGFDLFD